MSGRLFFAPLARGGAGLHPELARLLHFWPQKGSGVAIVLEGVRTIELQQRYVAEGRSQTLQSAHLSGRAFDIWPCDTNGRALWPDAPYLTSREKADRWLRADQLSCELFEVADAQGIAIVNGRDWDADGIPTEKDPTERGKIVDMPHWQIPWPAQRVVALEGRDRRVEARARGERPVR